MCPHDLTARSRQPHRLQVCLPRVAASSSLAVHTIIARIQPAHRAHCCLSRRCTIRRLSPTLRTLAAGGLFHWYWQRTLGRVGQVRLQTCAEAGPRKLAVVRLRHGRLLSRDGGYGSGSSAAGSSREGGSRAGSGREGCGEGCGSRAGISREGSCGEGSCKTGSGKESSCIGGGSRAGSSTEGSSREGSCGAGSGS